MKAIFRLIAAGLVLVLGASGCRYSQYDLQELVGKYNTSVEQLEEEAILANIVRASQGAPIGFTQLAVVRGSGTLTIQAGIPTVTTGNPGQQLFAFGPNGVSNSGNTNFDLGILESKEFWAGMLTPLSAETLAFFVRQGAPRSILFYLYIQRVEISTAGKSTTVEINNPLDPNFAVFSSDLQAALNLGITADTVTQTFNFGPPLPASQAANVNNLLSIAKSGFNIVPVQTKNGSAYQLQRSASGAVICFDQTFATETVLDHLPASSTCQAMKGQSPPEPGSFSFQRMASGARPAASITIYPRSTYDIFRYLGTLVRASERTGQNIDLGPGESVAVDGTGPLADKLFVVSKNSPEVSYLSIKYGNDTYSIPRSATTTIEVLALLRQMVALSTSINALPSGGTVTTVVH